MSLDGSRDANQFNAGPPRRSKRKKSALYAILIPLAAGACWIGYQGLRIASNDLWHPHSGLFQNLDVPFRPQDVVRPLVDDNQTFDIIATVWLRTVPEGDMASRRDPHEDGLILGEKAIFSETVFRGLQLKTKKTKTTVTFQVPTEIFKRRELNNYDLRASFVLVPNTPSLLDNATEYSSWRPSTNFHPVRSWQYPPVRPWLHENQLSIGEHIVDAYGTFMPLLSFHNIQSRCSNSTNLLPKTADEGEEGLEEEKVTAAPVTFPREKRQWISTKGKSVLKSHPYIITRSFLRVADMTKLLNKKAYDEAHTRLMLTSCKRGVAPGFRASPRWKDCVRSFWLTGNLEVRVKLETGEEERTEWAYAPHLTLSRSAWGPLDLVPVPVNREDCMRSSSVETPAVPDEPTINVTWNIAFAGRSPAKLMAGDLLNQPDTDYDMTDIEAQLMKLQSDVELTQSFAGNHLRDDYHPRREIPLSMAASILRIIHSLLEMQYWYTRSSTVGISTSGIWLVAVATITIWLSQVAWNVLEEEWTFRSGPFGFVYVLFWTTGPYLGAFAMLKAVTRAEVRWWKRCIPLFRFSLPTHAERASQRIDARVTYRFKAAAFSMLTAFFYFVYHKRHFLIDARGARTPVKNNTMRIIYTLPHYTLFPATALGWTLQIILNYRMKTFAGANAAAAYFKFASSGIALMGQSPWIIGERTYGLPFLYYELFELVWWAVLALQAFMYLAVSGVDEEEDIK